MNEPAGFHIGAEMWADLAEKVGSTHSKMTGLKTPKPIDQGFRVYGAGVLTSTSPSLILPTNPPSGPASGITWNVRGVFLMGVDAHTAITGVTGVEFYCGPPPAIASASQPVSPQYADLIPGSTGITTAPTSLSAARHMVWAKNKEMPYALVYGGTAGVQVFFGALVEVWYMSDALKLHVGSQM